jgi:hypothetical protein
MRIPHTIAVPALAVSIGLLSAGCGSSSPTAGTAQTLPPAQAAYAYARCMRHHGVGDFPDPHVSTSAGQTSISQIAPGSIVASPAFKSAQKACAGLQPGPQRGGPDGTHGPGRLVLLVFARCLRAHGITSFPDPNAQGQLSLEMIRAAGVNLHAPGFFTTARKCLGVTHGAITPAQLAAAINGPH